MTRCTTTREDRHIAKMCLQDRFKTAVEKASEVNQEFGREISARTVQRRLNEVGLIS